MADVEVKRAEASHRQPWRRQRREGRKRMVLKGKVVAEVRIKASAEDFISVFIHRPHHISNICSEKIQSCGLHEGEWGEENSVIVWNYVFDGKAQVGKEIIEGANKEEGWIRFKLIEGHLLEEYKSFVLVIETKKEDDWTLLRWGLEYEKLAESIPEPYKLLEFLIQISRDIDEHLLLPPTTTTPAAAA